jgi:hypothetical protein
MRDELIVALADESNGAAITPKNDYDSKPGLHSPAVQPSGATVPAWFKTEVLP